MKVKNYPSSKRLTNSYREMAESVLATLDDGVDILCKLESSRKHQEKEYGINPISHRFFSHWLPRGEVDSPPPPPLNLSEGSEASSFCTVGGGYIKHQDPKF